MRTAIGLLIIALIMLTGSCVPTSKITYLQESKSVLTDSLISIRKVQPPYRLQVNDILSINVKAPLDPDVTAIFNIQGEGAAAGGTGAGLYFSGYTVDSRGEIRIPILGNMNVLGYTVEEVREQIETRLLTDYLRETANLFVTVKLGGLRYTMVGEVSGTGQKTIFRDQVSIIEAMADGGGVPITGDLTKVKIVRQYPDGVRVHELDLTSLDVVYSPYYMIQPNDMIVVDPLPQKALGTGTTGLASFTTILSVFTALVTTVLFVTNLNN
ncbi:MAG: polysaccharide biosynthesis/export family protein [Nonlabens sp.]|nr:polysaccharide biosynthesis/export family protein [Nonlabens sp.]